MCAKHNATRFPSDGELVSEIEDLIFGGSITEEEYIDLRTQKLLALTAENIPAPMYSFHDRQVIKLATLHSRKDLAFSVVLLFLPGPPKVGEYDDTALDRMYRKPIYVAMTRAVVDNLNIFLIDPPAEPALKSLGDVYEEFVSLPAEWTRSISSAIASAG